MAGAIPSYAVLLLMVCWAIGEKRDDSHGHERAADKYAETVEEPVKIIATPDPNGYILYCPCMGRFGNQAEQFVGALGFSKAVNRTLVLPPWVVYPKARPFASLQIPFDEWFQVEPLRTFHRVITMEQFMDDLAFAVWPKGRRIGFCYSFRDKKRCAMKDGNPFGPFWDHFGVDFDGYSTHQGILWNTEPHLAKEWGERFPPKQHPVLAFQGAPGSFPAEQENQKLQRYIEFSPHLEGVADKYIQGVLGGKDYVAVHLRNGPDLYNACEHVREGADPFFASEQCTGYAPQKTPLTYKMCAPSKQDILDKVKRVVKESGVKVLFVATDYDPMLADFKKHLSKLKVKVYKRPATDELEDPLVDIVILSKAKVFIGNCVSTFSSFVRRQRNKHNLPVEFFNSEK